MHKEQTQFYQQRVQKFLSQLEYKYILDKQKFKIEIATLESRFYDFSKINSFNYQEIQTGDIWGKPWQTAIFKISTNLSDKYQNKDLALLVDINAEALLLDDKGSGIYAFTHGTAWESNYKKDYFPITNKYSQNQEVEFYLEAAANGMFGLDLDPDPDLSNEDRFGTYKPKIEYIDLVVIEPLMRKFYFDFEVLTNQMLALEKDSVRRDKLLYCLNKCIDVYNDSVDNVSLALDVLKPYLSSQANASSLTAYSIGHAHIDTGWLWPVEESIRKIHRTYSSQMTMIDMYPEYKFGASQAQHYEFLEQYYPDTFNKIQNYIDKGSWEIQGGMWVEADCNIASGEALIRQFLYGKNYFKDKFNQDITNLWLPDVFGYSAALPQIMQICGVKYFQTQKISWSQFNKFPFHTFMWQGIDGSKVLTHFNPTNTYNGNMLPEELINAEKRYNQKGYLDSFLAVFGVGDGGGGVSFKHIERAMRQENLEGSPKVKFTYASDFFDNISKNNESLPKWVGELYLELHRGTLTSQAKVKKSNRELEILLTQLEKIYSQYSFDKYPQDEFDKLWKKVLINQFHDILPGSSIHEVYKVTHREYQQCFDKVDELLQKYKDNFLTHDNNCITIINTENIAYNNYIKLDKNYYNFNFFDCEGNKIESLSHQEETLLFLPLKAQEIISLNLQKNTNAMDKQSVINITDDFILENELICYKLSPQGEILSAIDKQTGQKIINKGNIFDLYVDKPIDWDAWDVDPFYENMDSTKPTLVSAELIQQEGISIANICLKINNSTIKQSIKLSNNTTRLDFDTNIWWDEVHKMLRVAFDTNIYSNKASFDIQYGYIERNTHRNTSWDAAKFEVVAHKYIDLSNYNHGVALLNDCKYGHKVLDNVIELNLLRAPTNPDPDCDKKQLHTIQYSLYPHANNLITSDVIDQARQLNFRPLIFDKAKANTKRMDLCSLKFADNASLEVIKKNAKEDSWIIRIVETKGIGCSETIQLRDIMNIYAVNAIEWNPSLITTANTLDINLKPFEIKTFKLQI